jgi:hypothetical protein
MFLIPLIVIVLAVLYIAAKTIRIVPQASVLIIERLGKFDRIATGGMNIITPFIDRPRSAHWTGMRLGAAGIDMANTTELPAAAGDHARQRDDHGRLDHLLADH